MQNGRFEVKRGLVNDPEARPETRKIVRKSVYIEKPESEKQKSGLSSIREGNDKTDESEEEKEQEKESDGDGSDDSSGSDSSSSEETKSNEETPKDSKLQKSKRSESGSDSDSSSSSSSSETESKTTEKKSSVLPSTPSKKPLKPGPKVQIFDSGLSKRSHTTEEMESHVSISSTSPKGKTARKRLEMFWAAEEEGGQLTEDKMIIFIKQLKKILKMFMKTVKSIDKENNQRQISIQM